MDKIQSMNEWLDVQEKYHRSLSNNNIKENVFADAMRQVKTMLKNKGWDETYAFLSDMIQKCQGSNMVGPDALAKAYTKIKTKMWSLGR